MYRLQHRNEYFGNIIPHDFIQDLAGFVSKLNWFDNEVSRDGRRSRTCSDWLMF